MKRFLVFLFTISLFIGFASVASAGYIVLDETNTLYEYLIAPPSSGGTSYVWEHGPILTEYSGENGCCGQGEIATVTLSIVADDVDLGEFDYVYTYQGDGTQDDPTLTELGNLEQQTTWTNFGYQPGPGGDTTETFFDLDCSSLNLYLPLSVRVEVPELWGVEIETSTLTVECSQIPLPSTLLLLGSGVVGLVGLRRRSNEK